MKTNGEVKLQRGTIEIHLTASRPEGNFSLEESLQKGWWVKNHAIKRD